MAVVKHSSSRANSVIGGVFNLVDLRVGAERALQDARIEAQRIVDAAKQEAEQLRTESRRDGYAKGEAQGTAVGLAEGRTKGAVEGHAAAKLEHSAALRAIETSFAVEFSRWMGVRDETMRFAERELAGIAVSMAESIVREHIAGDQSVIAREAQAAVALFARATRVTIEVSPEDAPIVAESMPQLSAALPEGATVSIVARAGIARGGCVVRSSEGTVDARIETQFRRMREGLFGVDAPDATSADATSADGRSADGRSAADNNASTTDSVEPPASDAGEDRS